MLLLVQHVCSTGVHRWLLPPDVETYVTASSTDYFDLAIKAWLLPPDVETYVTAPSKPVLISCGYVVLCERDCGCYNNSRIPPNATHNQQQLH